MMSANAFGKLLKTLRQSGGWTMRDFCLKYGFDPGNYSRLERGMFSPPQKNA
jgi:transcriptional regulator with XRE-family HTH domain